MKLEIAYQTQHLPPPYAFAAVFKCIIDEEIVLDFQQEYLGREDLSEDEIYAEGFSNNDDFQWKGNLGNNWIQPLKELLQLSFEIDPGDDSYIHITIDDKPMGFPEKSQTHEVLIQELIQAAYEASEKEAPLLIGLATPNQPEKTLKWYFKDRLFKVDENETIDWESGRKLMELIYSIEYETIKPSKKPNGTALNFGDQVWYPVENKQLAEKITQIVK